MLSPGNTKLGRQSMIWTFSLPSARTCPGRSSLCEAACYSLRLERWRPSVRQRYERNLQLAQQPDFVKRMVQFIQRRQIQIVRIHVGGDFFSAKYARKWYWIVRRLPATQFFCYTRSWRIPTIRRVLARMARLPNIQLWFSCDQQTGAPSRVPQGVRLAWLMSQETDLPPRANLVFRASRLRKTVQKKVTGSRTGDQILVCPVENGATGHRTSCEQCGVCWQEPTPSPSSTRTSLPLVDL